MNRRQTKKYVKKMGNGKADATIFIQSLFNGKTYQTGKNTKIGGEVIMLPCGYYKVTSTIAAIEEKGTAAKEIKRIEDVEFDFHYDTKCIECGKEIELYWNGGELDDEKCCGYLYSLEHMKTDFVVTKI